VKGDTGIWTGYFSLGGYAKVAGMIDESMDKDFIDKPPQPWEFCSKPVWQKNAVITAGYYEYAAGFAIFIQLTLAQGKQEWALTTIGYVAQNSCCSRYGIYRVIK
jgi:regulator of sigma E protease